MTQTKLYSPFTLVKAWFVDDIEETLNEEKKSSIEPFRLCLYLFMHLCCVMVLWVGFSWTALIISIIFYFIRMFFITAFYHRYFSHKSYKVSRLLQFIMAIACCTTGQRGPLWWAAHHREHHLMSDTENDPHTPKKGFLNSHMLWFLRRNNLHVDTTRIHDLMRYPELVWLEQLNILPLLVFFVLNYFIGSAINAYFPELDTNGFQVLVWGGFISTIVLYHATYSINSLAHLYGSRRFVTDDDSKNNFLLALLTLGEGWHNNHHRFPASVKQGFYPQEIDISYYLITGLSKIGLVRDMNQVPLHILEEGRKQ